MVENIVKEAIEVDELAEVHKYAAALDEGKAVLSFATLRHFLWLICENVFF